MNGFGVIRSMVIGLVVMIMGSSIALMMLIAAMRWL